MFTTKKAEKILNLVRREYSTLYNELIFIEEGEEFSMFEMFDMATITIQGEMTDRKWVKWMYKYLNKNYNLDSNVYMFNNFIEVFAFIHEIGHLYYKDLTTPEEIKFDYKEYKERVYNSYEEAWKTYREIPNEKLADEFAVNFIKNNTIKIWSIMNEITEEKAKEEFEFWSDWSIKKVKCLLFFLFLL